MTYKRINLQQFAPLDAHQPRAMMGFAIHILNSAVTCIAIMVSVISLPAVIQFSTVIGGFCLALLLVVPRLASLRYVRQRPGGASIATAIASNRRALGLWAAAWFTLHAALAFVVYFDGPVSFWQQALVRPERFLEVASLAILLLCALLSIPVVQRKCTWWRPAMMLVWLVPFMALVSSILAARFFRQELPLFGIVPVLLIFCCIAGYGVGFHRQRSSVDWWRIGLLTAGGVLAGACLL